MEGGSKPDPKSGWHLTGKSLGDYVCTICIKILELSEKIKKKETELVSTRPVGFAAGKKE